MAKEKKAKDDPFLITDDEAKKIKEGIVQSMSGVLCPKRNKAIGGTCKVCDYLQTQIYSKNYDEHHEARKWARQKRAKLSWFMNVVFPENPDKSIFLEVGDKAGNQIENGIKNKGWRDIVHPHKGKGRELQCTKTKGDMDWPVYSVDPKLEKADWEVPDKVWKSVPNLANIIEILNTTEMTEENYMHIRSLKFDETLTFRMCPPPSVTNGEKVVIAPVFRHWGVSEDQINGDESLNWRDSEDDKKDTVESVDSTGLDLSFSGEDKEDKKEDKKPEKKDKPSCFGKEDFFEDDDEENCIPCPWFKKCAKALK